MTDISKIPVHLYREKDPRWYKDLSNFYATYLSDSMQGRVLAKALLERYSQPECRIEKKKKTLFATNKERTYKMTTINVLRYEGLDFFQGVLEDFISAEHQAFLEAVKIDSGGHLYDLESFSSRKDKALKYVKRKSRQRPIWSQAKAYLLEVVEDVTPI